MASSPPFLSLFFFFRIEEIEEIYPKIEEINIKKQKIYLVKKMKTKA
jgi:hypothetical protein